jgi:DNA-binding CsgD family transcriptional regulator
LLFERGKLIVTDVQDGAALRGLLERAISASTGKAAMNAGAMLVSRAGKKPLQVVAGPIRPEMSALSGRAVAVAFITHPEKRPPSQAEMLRLLFGLTPAEVKLAASLLQANSLSEAADLIGVGRETVRSQLKSIFVKTGTRRQSQLIAMLVSLPGSIRGDNGVINTPRNSNF